MSLERGDSVVEYSSKIKGLQVRASLEALRCILEQDLLSFA